MNELYIRTDDISRFANDSDAVMICRTQRTIRKLDELGLPQDEFMTKDEKKQREQALAFYAEIDGLSMSEMQAVALKLAINRYIAYFGSVVTAVAIDDCDLNNPFAKALEEQTETMAMQAQVLKNMRAQIKQQDATLLALEEAQSAHRSALKQIEELKARLEQLEKEKSKTQNQLAKTTIALEKSNDQLRKNMEQRLVNMGAQFISNRKAK